MLGGVIIKSISKKEIYDIVNCLRTDKKNGLDINYVYAYIYYNELHFYISDCRNVLNCDSSINLKEIIFNDLTLKKVSNLVYSLINEMVNNFNSTYHHYERV